MLFRSEYGRSKLAAEQYLATTTLPYIILRPTGVYGPREKDYFIMAKSIKQHSDFAVGYKRQDITFVYVKDVVQAVFLALDKGDNGRKYFLSDGQVYQSTTFSNLIHEELGRPWWIRITAPVWVLRVVTFFGEYVGRMTGKVTALNNDKYNILKQRNGRCDIQPAIDELGYQPKVQLEEGVRILYLSLFRAVTLPVIRPTYSPTNVTMRSTHTGAVIRIHQGRPNASWMRLLKVAL